MTSHYPGYADETKGPKILAVFWVLTAFTLLIVISRLYIRAGVLRNMGADDWLITASMIMTLAYASVTSANVVLGYGRHADTLSPERLVKVSLVNYADFALGIVSFSLPKLAVAALLNRIMNPNWFQKSILWLLTGLVALTSGICIVVLFTMCDPPKALWDVSLVMQGNAKCRDISILIDYAIFTGAFSAFTDLYLAIYPAVVLMKLNMSTRKKIALCLALGLGSVACAMAIVKCFQLPGLANKTDPTYATAELVIWTWYVTLSQYPALTTPAQLSNFLVESVESNVVIIASCIPTLHPLLEMILRRRAFRSWSASRENYYHKGSGSNPMGNSTFGGGKRLNGAQKDNDLTITHVGSQESILRADGNNTTADEYGHPLSHIRRTDDVMVEYETTMENVEAGTKKGDTRGSW